jgi:uncharacterized membrane protein
MTIPIAIINRNNITTGYANEKASLGIPKFLRLARLPLQVALLFWAYQYT